MQGVATGVLQVQQNIVFQEKANHIYFTGNP